MPTPIGRRADQPVTAPRVIPRATRLQQVEFHSHDRLLLSASLALGITVAAGITVAERGILAPSRGVAAALPGSEAR